jgi:AraC family L-rhamnose operon regulatory protein RhaS
MNVMDNSNIVFEEWNDHYSVNMHRHHFYELLIVAHGSCRHMYRETETLLIPGDAVIVKKDEAHGFNLSGETRIYNCQFRMYVLDVKMIQMLNEQIGLTEPEERLNHEEALEWENALKDKEKEEYLQSGQLPAGYELNSNKQGVVHLSPSEFAFVNSVFQHGIEVQQKPTPTDELLKQKYLEVILLELKKTMERQNRKYQACTKGNQEAVAAALVYIENHLDEQLDFNVIAQNHGFSPNYFRKIFKDVTGFSTINYVNRLRVIRASEYIQEEKLSICEAAERVGIYDLNYFSRIFKKHMGCSPSKI